MRSWRRALQYRRWLALAEAVEHPPASWSSLEAALMPGLMLWESRLCSAASRGSAKFTFTASTRPAKTSRQNYSCWARPWAVTLSSACLRTTDLHAFTGALVLELQIAITGQFQCAVDTPARFTCQPGCTA